MASTENTAGNIQELQGDHDPERMANPHPHLAELRKAGPVIDDGAMMVQIVTRSSVEAALRDHRTFSSASGWSVMAAKRPLIPLQIDPPLHKEYRKLIDPLFAPRRMSQLVGPVTDLVNRRIDTFIDKGECIFDEEVGVPIPSEVFLTIVGFPLDDLDHLIELKDGLLRPGHREGVDPNDLQATLAIQEATAEKTYEYFLPAIQEARKAPGDDLIGGFVQAEVDGRSLSDEDILDICFLMLTAGLDTVTDSLSLFFAHLAQRPESRRAIAADLDIIPNAVEELLRYENPVPGVTPRIVTADTEIEGCAIPQGRIASINLAAANTDPDFMADADVVRFDREINPHLAFGGGVHRCLGSHLARQELRIVLREWHRRIPEYELAPGTELRWPPGLRHVENVHLAW
jgi:cytochrome P450